ncbi:hypothetical protein FHS68_001959 [Dyadobacter arcticus]|uniref:3-keto-alpha-glucoside-1,2-lyase/3-keto-2-hydroxy-glucal hydratase domain-containing protein n=2 Tax=Dyadobacter arcticus TaxID=1078754 RepID=A0ABX0UIE8_9BACT|nr:hypothetical protein [Dyadobacter arcticus]
MRFILLLCCVSVLTAKAFGQQKMGHGTSLFNGKDLTGWETYLDRPDQNNKDQAPLGLNNDPNKVFSVVIEDGEPAIRISGETFGAVSTLESFGNYHLQLQFKWGKQKWAPKLDQPRDSGLLFHSVGDYGSSFLWKKSFEFQVQEGDCGDYWGVMDVLAEAEAFKNEQGKYVYKKGAERITFRDKTPNGRTCLKGLDNELKSGEWNTVDLYCFGGTAVHMINGKINMVLTNTRHMVNGKEEPLVRGQIQIQSEGAEVFYRNLTVEPITLNMLPKGI